MATLTKRDRMIDRIEKHGRALIVLFGLPRSTSAVRLCQQLRRLEAKAARIALQQCNGPDFPGGPDEVDKRYDAVLKQVNDLLGNVHEYQPKTGAKCGCKRDVMRDNCSNCEGTGLVVNFAAIRSRKPLIPVFINRDPRGYQLKIDDAWIREHKPALHTDWGGYGIIAPDLTND